MPDITLEEIQNKFESLPENLRLAIIVAGADKKVNSIGREHGLNIKQIAELLLRTHVVMFGFVHPDKLVELVGGITKIPPQVVKGITRDLNEQIIKDIKADLINLAEKPQTANEVESFIGESTPGGKPMTQEELTADSSQLLKTPELEAPSEAKKEGEILKSTGIDIPAFETEKDIDNTLRLINKETTKKEESLPEKVLTQEDKKNDEILKAAGIEIPTIIFKETTEKKPEEKLIVPLVAVERKEEKEPTENTEIMKIAFSNLPKEKEVVPPIVQEIQKLETIPSSIPYLSELKPEDVIEKTPKKEVGKEIPKETTEKLTVTQEKKPIEQEKIEAKPPEEEKPSQQTILPSLPAPIPASTPTSTLAPSPAKEVEGDIYSQTKPIEPQVDIKPLEKQPKVVPSTTPEPPQVTETRKEEKPLDEKPKESITEAEQTQEEKKKSAELKTSVGEIIAKYEDKSKSSQPEPVYSNKEEEKRVIVMRIVEVQDSIKKMKDRLNQITKEKGKLEKEKRGLTGTGKTEGVGVMSASLADLTREEKMIQVLRESILPKEYLDLLVRLDKLSHNPPEEGHK